MSRFTVSPEARADLNGIWDYIARESIDAADRVRDELEQAILRLAEMPTIGHLREDLADETLRVWRVRTYLIIYRPSAVPLEIVRVIDTAISRPCSETRANASERAGSGTSGRDAERTPSTGSRDGTTVR